MKINKASTLPPAVDGSKISGQNKGKAVMANIHQGGFQSSANAVQKVSKATPATNNIGTPGKSSSKMAAQMKK